MKTAKALFGIFLITAALALSVEAQGTITWNWTYINANNGNIDGSGTLTTESTITISTYRPSVTGYLITGISGGFTGNIFNLTTPDPITSLSAIGLYGNDNMLNTLGQIDSYGLTFFVNDPVYGNEEIHIYKDVSGTDFAFNDANGGWGTFSAIPEAVPEPTPLALFLIGGIGVLIFYHLRRGRTEFAISCEQGIARPAD